MSKIGKIIAIISILEVCICAICFFTIFEPMKQKLLKWMKNQVNTYVMNENENK
jgi:hypothetical protein